MRAAGSLRFLAVALVLLLPLHVDRSAGSASAGASSKPGFLEGGSIPLAPLPLDGRPIPVAPTSVSVLYKVSPDARSTQTPVPRPLDPPFSPEVAVTTDSDPEDHPSIAAAPDGTWILVAYTRVSPSGRDVYVARSTDGGLTWTQTALAANASFDEFDARVVVHGTRAFVFFGHNDPGFPRAFRYAVSTDEGVSWTVSQVNYGTAGPFRDIRTPDASSYRGQYLYAVYGMTCDNSPSCSPLQSAVFVIMFNATGQLVGPAVYFPFTGVNYTAIETTEPAMYAGPTKTVFTADVGAYGLPRGRPGQHDIVFMDIATGEIFPNWGSPHITGLYSDDRVRVDAGGIGRNITFAYELLNASAGFPNRTLADVYTNDDGGTWSFGTVAGGAGAFRDPAVFGFASVLHATFLMNMDLGYAQSPDGGRTWSAPLKVNSNTGTVADGIRADDVTYAAKVRVVWTDNRSGNLDILYADADGLGGPNPVPRAALPMDAVLAGPGLGDVALSWSPSPDDGGGGGDVAGYRLYESAAFDANGVGYALLADLPAGATSFVAPGVGVGDPETRFFRLEVRDTAGQATASPDQFVKYAQHLNAGAHLLSIPIRMSDPSVENVLRGVDYSVARTYVNAAGQGKNWLTKAQDKPWGDLLAIDGTQGVWLSVRSDSELVVAGVAPASTTIHLDVGWNFVGYPSFVPRTAEEALAGAQVQSIEGFDSTNAPWYLRRLEPTTLLGPGDGVWIHVSQAFDWSLSNS